MTDRRTFQPVRAGSFFKGKCEAPFWGAVSREWLQRALQAAQRYDDAQKKPGDRQGPIGPCGLKVFRFLVSLVDRKSGRLEPALDTIAAAVKLSRASVVRALDRLRRHGFLDWLRRCEPTGEEGVRGPQVRQVSNAYKIMLSAAAALLLPAKPPQFSLDHVWELKERWAVRRRWRSEMSLKERVADDFEDPGLGAAVLRFQAAGTRTRVKR